MSANSDNHRADKSTGEKCLLIGYKGKKQVNSAKLQVQEYEEQEEQEWELARACEVELAALMPEEQEEQEWELVRACEVELAALTPEEQEERRKADEATGLSLGQWLQE
jgi:hypothetical protein